MEDRDVTQAPSAAPAAPAQEMAKPQADAGLNKSAAASPSAPSNDPTAPAKNVGTDQPGQSPSPAGQLNRAMETGADYKELRRWATRVSQENATANKKLEAMSAQIAQLTQAFSKATQAPHDPERFLEEFKARGPEFLNDHFTRMAKEMEKQYTSKLSERDAKIEKLEITYERDMRRRDTGRYPDFEKLEPEMIELLDSGAISETDMKSKPVSELLDQLYNLVRLQHSQDALKAAEQYGRKSTEAELAREAHTAVAGGGKVNPPAKVDTSSMSAADMRALAMKHGMVVERD